LVSFDTARSKIQDETFLILDGCLNFRAIQDENRHHRRMSDALVAIDKGMPLDQREAQRGGHLSQRGIQINTTEGGLRLRDRRLKRSEITKSHRAAGYLKDSSM
jgi:hypothetical protein